jgi:hypothetical protein
MSRVGVVRLGDTVPHRNLSFPKEVTLWHWPTRSVSYRLLWGRCQNVATVNNVSSSRQVELANYRRSYDIVPVKRDQRAQQQRIADTYHAAGLIPVALNAADIRIGTAPSAAK